MIIEKVKIGEVKKNPDNPRIIKDEKFKKLVNSIKEFPEMLEARPIVVDEEGIVLGGNMRLEACKKAGLDYIYIIKWSNLSEEKKKEFIVKDNVGYGEWDWSILEDEWNLELLDKWGMDLPKGFGEDEEDKFSDGELGFNEDIDFESNYIVLKFNKDIDWIQAQSIFGLEKGWNRGANGKGRSVGLGRVIDGVDAILKIKENIMDNNG